MLELRDDADVEDLYDDAETGYLRDDTDTESCKAMPEDSALESCKAMLENCRAMALRDNVMIRCLEYNSVQSFETSDHKPIFFLMSLFRLL